MKEHGRDSWQTIFVGQEQSGKTFAANHAGEMYAQGGGTVLAYNAGRPRDFENFDFVDFVGFRETVKGMSKKAARQFWKAPEIRFFRYGGKYYRMKDFCKVFAGKKVKAFRMSNRREENALFLSFYDHLKDTLIIIDDSKPLYRYGLTDGHITLFSRKNHCGIYSTREGGRLGVDIISVFHNIDQITPTLIDYTDSLLMFATTNAPKLNNFEDEQIKKVLAQNWQRLKSMPKYSSLQTFLKGKRYCQTVNSTIHLKKYAHV
jgi:hypothetical protein